MANRSNTPCWEAPKFTSSTQNQAEGWRSFHECVIDFLESLDTDIDAAKDDVQGRGLMSPTNPGRQ